MPKISVLMPVYKPKEAYLREAIQSILDQTFTDFELLILDDCPEDDREQIIKSYQDHRILYVKNEQNLGIALCRNKLIDMAAGEYLAIMDHDDISLPDRFEKQVAFLDAHPNVGVVGSWIDDFLNERIYKFPSEDLDIKVLLMDICAITHPASMIRKSVLEQHHLRYEAEFTPSEDYRLWCRLIEFTQFHNIPEILFKYRMHSGNTSNTHKKHMEDKTKQLHVWIRGKYPLLYQRYMHDRTKRITVKLFNLLPLLTILMKAGRIKVYLFGLIPLIGCRRKVLSWPK